MPSILARFLAVMLLGCLTTSATAQESRPRSPNILIIVADDLGWRDVGFHDSEIKTPHLDKLAKEGLRLERHYVYPSCSPTRAGLFTGRNPSRFKIHGAIGGRSPLALPTESINLAKMLKARDYSTAIMGKWHLGLRPEVGPKKYGYDQTYGYFHGQIDQYTHIYKNGDRTWHRNDEFVDEKGHATDLITDEAVQYLSAKRKNPFFLWVAFSVPHYPVQEEERRIDAYKDSIKDPSRRLYAASVTHMDEAIGRMMEALEKSGQRNDTLVVFTSDNGGQKDHASKTDYEGKHGPYPTLGDNRPWRGWKTELYEGGIRVPAIVSWKGQTKVGNAKETVSMLDWLPTIAAITGTEPKADWKLEGRDVRPILLGKGVVPSTKPLYWNIGSGWGLLNGDWKLIVGKKVDAPELYNLAEDPTEKNNLAAKNPEKLAELRRIMEAQQKLDP